jgi:hypothetical protein
MTCRCGQHFCYRCGGPYDENMRHACRQVSSDGSSLPASAAVYTSD